MNILKAENIRYIRAKPSTKWDNKANIEEDGGVDTREDNKVDIERDDKPETVGQDNKPNIGKQDNKLGKRE